MKAYHTITLFTPEVHTIIEALSRIDFMDTNNELCGKIDPSLLIEFLKDQLTKQ